MKFKNGTVSALIFGIAALLVSYTYYTGWLVSLFSVLIGGAYCAVFEVLYINEFNRGDTYGIEWQGLSVLTILYLVVPSFAGLFIVYSALVVDLPGSTPDRMLCLGLTLLSAIAAVTIDWAVFRSKYLQKQRTAGKQVLEEAVADVFSRRN